MNDIVLYSWHGVCTITDITEKEFNGNKANYYVLKPVHDTNSTIFVPAENENVTAKMRRVLSSEEIHALIKNMPNEDTIWIEDDNQRKEKYKEIISKGNRSDLIRLIKTLYLHQQAQKKLGKKMYIIDEKFMKEAEKLLYDEFAHVLDIKPEEVVSFIMRAMDVEEKQTQYS